MQAGSTASARLTWAVGCLDIQPGERVLELGCGHGVAVSLVCERIGDGTIVAIDRSATMTAAAEKRNRKHVDAGRARILTSHLHEANLGDARFDKVYAIHFPPFLRGDPAREFAVVAEHLELGGRLFLLSQPFDGRIEQAVDHSSRVLAENRFAVEDVVVVDDLETGPAVCVTAGAAR
jgi:cyclopropane fatty-acyl-phospholipid synthase-like methyltransferase